MNGRFQPFDSVARNSLLQFAPSKPFMKRPAARRRRSPPRLAARSDDETGVGRRPESFRIDNNEVTELLKLPDNQKFIPSTSSGPGGRNRKAGQPHRIH